MTQPNDPINEDLNGQIWPSSSSPSATATAAPIPTAVNAVITAHKICAVYI